MLEIEKPDVLKESATQLMRQLQIQRRQEPPYSVDAIVVLGGNIVRHEGNYITTPYGEKTKKSDGAQGRVIAAAILYHLGISDCLIVSSGKTDPEDVDAPSEAEVMKRELREYGIPEDCIVLEDQSTTTQTNARELTRMFDGKLADKKNIAVITASWHIRRAHAFLREEGLFRNDRVVSFRSSEVIIWRYLPKFFEDIYKIYHSEATRRRIGEEWAGYKDLSEGKYCSLPLGDSPAAPTKRSTKNAKTC
jgi:uncharacterized SAM-binding protein YcdF (DUF218 family)